MLSLLGRESQIVFCSRPRTLPKHLKVLCGQPGLPVNYHSGE